jgi:hypothetical protein
LFIFFRISKSSLLSLIKVKFKYGIHDKILIIKFCLEQTNMSLEKVIDIAKKELKGYWWGNFLFKK